jgi:prepilin-type N-terminal cleavage/methylation domain-containing protein
MRQRPAYTLIELLVVITIMALLVVLVVINYSGIMAKSRDQRRLNDLKSIQLTIETYKFENKKCPDGGNEIVENLLESKRDPKTNQRYYYSPHPLDCKYQICALMETKRNLGQDWEGYGAVYNYCLFGDRVNREVEI